MSAPKIRCWKCNTPLTIKDVKWVEKKEGIYAYCRECEE